MTAKKVSIEKVELMTERCPVCGFWLSDRLVQNIVNTKRLNCPKCKRKFRVTKAFGTEVIVYEV